MYLLLLSPYSDRPPSVFVCTTRADRIVTVAVRSSINVPSWPARLTPPTNASSVSVMAMRPSVGTVVR